ncbi:MAG TPA: Dam family site-specific DNA-(adenine-N6)-methyltransferase [Candidatus Baltobacteraceae bacterium]|jgi:DNA adenine methylase|nr:Dam family site-specific DNA-(adenine-N6)-methyltransferase [Candidatus Baltobacteraceae bacterium]
MIVLREATASGIPPLVPPLKWAGGKRWLVPALLPYWQPHRSRRLVEPFAGGLAITLGLVPRRALLNDSNPQLIAFYTWLQRGIDLSKCGVTFENDRTVYAKNRTLFNELIRGGQGGSAQAAALFYYLNRTGYNGLCRFNARGFFNVPFGRYKRIPYRLDAESYREAFAAYEFTCGDFAVMDVQPDDFVYADPPYDVEFTSYSAGGFTWDDQLRLARWLAAHPGPVVASNQATPRICRLYRSLGFTVRKLAAPRRISCDGNREDAEEMLAVRNV